MSDASFRENERRKEIATAEAEEAVAAVDAEVQEGSYRGRRWSITSQSSDGDHPGNKKKEQQPGGGGGDGNWDPSTHRRLRRGSQ
jgi:hypothetical protein